MIVVRASVIQSIDEVAAEEWNALDLGGNPTVSHEFLSTLEHERCVGRHAGWSIAHIVLRDDNGVLVGALPLYRKTHSWGEFVFDFSWAQAYAQAGLHYYPKLVGMVPFTPVPGPRLLVRPQLADQARTQLCDALVQMLDDEGASSAHILFVQPADRACLEAHGFMSRKDCQFHWFNRGYETFEDFLATFRSEKRKKAARERRRIQESGIEHVTLAGEDIDDDLWEIIFAFSAQTFAMRGHEHYLTAGFFRTLSRQRPGTIMVKLARFKGEPIAAAIFFVGADTLYGRYWGAAADFHSLHFETCYYQGIEYCIERKLSRFEPGTQGEHKVPRGFEPTATWSVHRIQDSRFKRAIQSYLRQEEEAVDRYIAEVEAHVPYRRDAATATTRDSR